MTQALSIKGLVPYEPSPRPLPLLSAHERLVRSNRLLNTAALLALVAWLNYTIHGFRMPWQPIVVSDSNGGAAMRQMLFVLAGGLAGYRLISTRAIGLTIVHQLPWFGVAGLLVVSAAWSQETTLTIKRSIIFSLGLIALATLTHGSRQPMATMQRVVVNTAGINAMISVMVAVALPADCTSIAQRPGLAGVSSHPNTLAAIMFTGHLLGLGMSPASRLERSWWRLNQLVILVAIVWTGSVTALFVTLVGTGIYFGLSGSGYRRGVVVLLTIAFAVFVSLIGIDNVKSWLFDTVNRDETLSGRDTLWPTVFGAAMERPLLGSGFGGFWYEGRGRELTGTWNPRQAHNAYLDVFVDLGLLGSVIVIGLILGVLGKAWRVLRTTDSVSERRAIAGTLAFSLAMLLVYGMSQSFLLKLDQFSSLSFVWGLLLFTSTDRNANGSEFSGLPQENPARVDTSDSRTDDPYIMPPEGPQNVSRSTCNERK